MGGACMCQKVVKSLRYFFSLNCLSSNFCALLSTNFIFNVVNTTLSIYGQIRVSYLEYIMI